ncbi:F-box protein At5g03970-like [Lycium barbarum]|uniref:F-box protein At5g03970-like n=1 Tax=Lycium barbarum TaxID=112863 RepID=UPI00293F09A7|nr:F-box protein At5g03970-like [Lycium barbarum]
MKRMCKMCDKSAIEFSEDIIMEILHRLPSKALARFRCVSKCWLKYIADCRYQRWKPQPDLIGFFYQAPETHIGSQIRFFYSSKEVIDGSLDNSVDNLLGIGKRVSIAASSNGFLLCVSRVCYSVYNPATRQCLALPKTRIYMKDHPAVGFICKVDDPDIDVISFTIVRYEIPMYWDSQFTIAIEIFSSETNVWTANHISLDVPLRLYHSTYMKSPSASVIDGVFCWLDDAPQITFYDSVHKHFWALELPEDMVTGGSCYLGLSGRALYFALSVRLATVTVWYLASNIRSRDAVWVKKYVANVANTVLKCPDAYGLVSSPRIEVQNMAIHPAVPRIFYLGIRGKVISYDFETDNAELVYDFGESYGKTYRYKLFSYEWHQWPRLL